MKFEEIKLKRIVENLDAMPNKMSEYLGNETPKLSVDDKRKLLDMVGRYNEYGNMFESAKQLIDMSKTLDEISSMAETYAVNEAGDWFDRGTVKRDFTEIKKRSKEFQKLAKECFNGMQQMNALYEDIGHTLQRYYEIKDLNPTVPQISTNPSEKEQFLNQDDQL